MDISMMSVVFGVLVYVICGVLAYGAAFAHLQGECAGYAGTYRAGDAAIASFLGILGPIGLASSFFGTWWACGCPFYHGFAWRWA